jgi:DNA-binding NarL/FixJ family response regulator
MHDAFAICVILEKHTSQRAVARQCQLQGRNMKLFIVEDSEMVREHMLSMLSDNPNVEVVGYAADELGAIERINTLLPDVVTLDLCLQHGAGINVLKNIKKHHPEIKVIVLANDDNRVCEDGCMRAAADCYFDKTFQFSRFCSAIWSWSNAGHAVNRTSL